MERMKKWSQRRRLGVYCLVAGKAKWKSWINSVRRVASQDRVGGKCLSKKWVLPLILSIVPCVAVHFLFKPAVQPDHQGGMP